MITFCQAFDLVISIPSVIKLEISANVSKFIASLMYILSVLLLREQVLQRRQIAAIFLDPMYQL